MVRLVLVEGTLLAHITGRLWLHLGAEFAADSEKAAAFEAAPGSAAAAVFAAEWQEGREQW